MAKSRAAVIRAALAKADATTKLEPGMPKPLYPRPGVWGRCKIVQLVGAETDFVLVRLPGCEIQVALLDCVGPSLFIDGDPERTNAAGQAALKLFWQLVDRQSDDGGAILYLPQPPNDRGFFKSIKPGSKWPGVIYFPRRRESLNDQLLASGLYSRPILRMTPRAPAPPRKQGLRA